MTTPKRHKISETARIEVHGQPGPLMGYITNMSRTGACVEIYAGDYLPQKGDMLHLTTTWQDLDAEVVWSKTEGTLGVCFVTRDEVPMRMMEKTTFGK